MCVCMYVCVRTCMHVSMLAYMCMRVSVCVYVHDLFINGSTFMLLFTFILLLLRHDCELHL